MKLDTHPVTGEPREFLTFSSKRRLLDTPEAIARRRRYRLNKPKKKRIHCQHCNKRFTPKRSTRKFCGPVCRNLNNIYEHKLFKEHNIFQEWYSLSSELRKSTNPIDLYRELLQQKLNT
jgi:hypothetical protein